MATVDEATEAELFIELPFERPERVLLQTSILETQGARRKVATVEPVESLQPGMDVVVYYDFKNEFVKQPASVIGSTQEDLFVLELELVGDPASAEQRKDYRVSCLGTDATATLGDEADCRVVDLSATGFAAYSTQTFHVGQTLTATFHCNGEAYPGKVTVFSLRPMSPTVVRCGMRALDDTDDDTLCRSLPRISLALQREQQRRV